MKKVAVIGAGIAGLAAAYFISRKHRVWLFEREARLGGHTHTVSVDDAGRTVPLDTGFLVHNDRTYPNLIQLFREVGVETRASDMSFGVTCRRTGFEYSSRGAAGFFAQKRNLVRPRHLRLLADIVRFNAGAPQLLAAPDADRWTIGDYVTAHGFGDEFVSRYLYPMTSAIWSASFDGIRTFPALTMIRFMENHGMLSVGAHPAWRVLRGGSSTYIPALAAPLEDRVEPGASIRSVTRGERDVSIAFDRRPSATFDDVVFACHGNQVLPLLADASDTEREVFGRFQTSRNETWLHSDASFLPRRPRARASWNYELGTDDRVPPAVTYDLNRLQGVDSRRQFCVTLNPAREIDPRSVIRRMTYWHPQYTRESVAAQGRWPEVSGRRRTHYCGAYWFYGFHEDGLRSALRVARAFGVEWGTGTDVHQWGHGAMGQ